MLWWTNNRLYLKDGHCIIIHCLNFNIFSSRFNLVASKVTTLVRFVSNINFVDGLYGTARRHIRKKITLKSSKRNQHHKHGRKNQFNYLKGEVGSQ